MLRTSQQLFLLLLTQPDFLKEDLTGQTAVLTLKPSLIRDFFFFLTNRIEIHNPNPLLSSHTFEFASAVPEDVDIPVIYKQKDKDWVDTIPEPSDEKQEGKKGKQSTNGFIHR